MSGGAHVSEVPTAGDEERVGERMPDSRKVPASCGKHTNKGAPASREVPADEGPAAIAGVPVGAERPHLHAVACCDVCPRRCALVPGQLGFCRARRNVGGVVVPEAYGRVTSLALDPVEKKPLARWHPGSLVLSAGSYGCNLRCPFCQNWRISQAGPAGDEKAGHDVMTRTAGGLGGEGRADQAGHNDGEGGATTRRPDRGVARASDDPDGVPWRPVSPEELVALACRRRELDPRVIGIAHTYNEPLVSWEYVRDCALLARRQGLATVLVSNGCASEAAARALVPLLDAANVDLKSWRPEVYRRYGGDLDAVRRTIEMLTREPDCHLEVTTLVVPGENDSPAEMDAMARWLASLDPDLTLHVTRFFPCWHMADRAPTPVAVVRGLADVARRHLRHVLVGNC